MKRKVSILTLVVILCLTSAYAGSQYETIGVYFGAVSKIFVNEKDVTANFKEPIMYNGTTYVALRDVSEALGQSVEWDGQNKAIYIGGKPKTFRIENTNLTDLKFHSTFNTYLYRINNRVDKAYNLDLDHSFDYPLNYKMCIPRKSQDGAYTEYENGIALKGYDTASVLYYDLNKEYTVLKGMVGFDKKLNEENYDKFLVRFISDLKVISEIELSEENLFEDFNIPVIDVDILTIEFVNPNKDEYEPHINLVNAVLENHIIE